MTATTTKAAIANEIKTTIARLNEQLEQARLLGLKVELKTPHRLDNPKEPITCEVFEIVTF